MILRLEGLAILILSYLSAPCRAGTVAIDDQDPSVNYSGGWAHWKKGDANTPQIEQAIGAPIPSGINTLSGTGAPSSPATVTFQGTSIGIVALRLKLGGTISVTLDGKFMQNVDMSGTSNALDTVWTSPPLSNEPHSLSIAKLVSNDPNSQKTFININYFSVEQPSTSPSTPPPSNSNPTTNSQPLPSAADTTANQSSIAPDAPDASPIPSSSSPSLSTSNQPLSPSSSLSGNSPLISGSQVSSGSVQQNPTAAHDSLGNTGKPYAVPPSGVSSSSPGSTDVAASILKPASSKTLVAVAGTLGGIAAVAIIILAYIFLRRRKERKIRELRRMYGCSEKTGMSDPQMDRDIELLQRKMDPDAPPSYPGHSHGPSGVALGEAF